VLPKARREYTAILEYLSGFYPGTPTRFRNEFKKASLRLEFNPFGCSVFYGNPAYRRALVGKYTMLYKINEERHEVHIHRIIRSSWDIPGALRQSEDTEEEQT